MFLSFQDLQQLKIEKKAKKHFLEERLLNHFDETYDIAKTVNNEVSVFKELPYGGKE